ncbi:MAG: protein DA1 [Anaerolineae bacterium]|nr:protein DA1 [Anaerolineae bacterium]
MYSIPVCAGCNKLIFKDYIQAQDGYWHPECFCCEACGKPIEADFNARDEKVYHPLCYQKMFSPVCAGCGEIILDQYISALDKKWHPEHFTCAHCGQMIEDQTFFVNDSKPYCQKDYLALFTKKCSVCRQSLVGEYSVDLWGNHYCTQHKNELPTCTTCSRLICDNLTQGGVQYRDGRYVCNICRQSAVDQPSLARSIYRDISKFVAGYGLAFPQVLSLKLVDQNEIKRSAKKSHKDNTMGVTRTSITTQNGRETGREAEILILHGLPRELFTATLVHELGHSWLFLNRYPQLKPIVEEGFCELLSYLWLSKQKTAEADFRLQAMRKNPDLVYGRGYRAALRAYKKYSFDELTRFIRQNQSFPA